MDTYDPHEIERKWQQVWEEARAFAVDDPAPGADDDRHFYMLEMLPYPSGNGLHMGHVLNYTLGDVVTHFRRRTGHTVLRPMGFDSFGLPAENAAIREGGHPREITERNIASIRTPDAPDRLGDRLGPRGLGARAVLLPVDAVAVPAVLRARARIPQGGAGQLVPGRPGRAVERARRSTAAAERCGAPVETRNMEQWFFKITEYADALLDDLATIDWPQAHEEDPERLDRPLRRSRGPVPGRRARPRHPGLHDAARTRCSARRSSCSRPSRPLVDQLVDGTDRADEVRAYARIAGARSTVERETREKTGVFTGRHVTNPVNGELLPIWVADYVLMEYGTGAIMAVPAHDERDREFAEKFDLPIVPVIDDDGKLIASGAVRRPAVAGGEGRDRRLARRARTRQAVDQLPAARLELLASALLGLPDPDHLLR